MNAGNEPVLSVSELDRRLKRAVEGVGFSVWVEGELASLKRASSGHVYFTLKDERDDAVIDCVMYKFDATRARRLLVEGSRIQLLGRATVWAPRGRLQFVGTLARAAGRGALLEALEKLKATLASEGLFAPERKRPLPLDPRIVGVVTSADGAAFHDIRSVAFRRGNVRLVLSRAVVQGENAPQSIVHALDRLERYPGIDVIIVGRGGGSAEDLMAFNDERVVRRVASLRVPVVSAVGHEVDVALTDLVADMRAATPSQAAELVVPDVTTRRDRVVRLGLHLARAMAARISFERHRALKLQQALSDPRFTIAERQEQLDDLAGRLSRRITRSIRARKAAFDGLDKRLAVRHPRAVLARSRIALGLLKVELESTQRRSLFELRARFRDACTGLDALSPLAVLGRGYAIVQKADGAAVRDPAELASGEAVGIRIARGRFTARVEAIFTEPSETDASIGSLEPRNEGRS